MRYFSTRDAGISVTASRAMVMGLAPDGGLFVPESLPVVGAQTLRALCGMDYDGHAAAIMGPFLEEFSEAELRGHIAAAYGQSFNAEGLNAPLRVLDGETAVLELFHGPTCAFKDMALQIMPRLLVSSLKKCGETKQACILVATSGDTGKAALEGFRDVPGTSILVFYPKDGVSDVQQLQMCTQAGGNVGVVAVEGNFDDAQAGVKAIFNDRAFADELAERGWFLSSANSINWGRLLPQIVYYFSAYCDLVNAGGVELGGEIDFCVPTGNFGDILAGWYAKKMGLPVRRLLCASNANKVLTEFFETGVYDRKRPFYNTASPSMDILVSSNLERLLFHIADDTAVRGWMEQLGREGRFDVGPEVLQALCADFDAGYCDDAATGEEIARVYRSGYLMDTHTAVASRVLLERRGLTGERFPTVIVSTASPFKFCDSVLKALGESADAPGTALIDRLSALTGLCAPAPLASLAGRELRFHESVKKDGMKAVVDAFLKTENRM
jgi:threonine synthase